MQNIRLFPFVLCTALIISSCARNMDSNVYSDSSAGGKVLEGKIISVRAVSIKAHDKLQDNTLGGLGGAAAGGLAGSQIGRGNGSVAGALGGAIVGAVAGALAQDALGTSQGTEYLVKLDKQYVREYDKINRRVNSGSKQTVEQDMAASTSTGTKTDIVSVVQATDQELHVGSHVFIIYNDDRPRLTADNQAAQ